MCSFEAGLRPPAGVLVPSCPKCVKTSSLNPKSNKDTMIDHLPGLPFKPFLHLTPFPLHVAMEPDWEIPTSKQEKTVFLPNKPSSGIPCGPEGHPPKAAA